VTFNPNECFVENMKNQGKLIAKGERNGHMFTLDVNMPKVIPCYSHMNNMEKELETLKFGTSELAMLISNVLS
jgi:hypothetical protein